MALIFLWQAICLLKFANYFFFCMDIVALKLIETAHEDKTDPFFTFRYARKPGVGSGSQRV